VEGKTPTHVGGELRAASGRGRGEATFTKRTKPDQTAMRNHRDVTHGGKRHELRVKETFAEWKTEKKWLRRRGEPEKVGPRRLKKN